MIEREQRPWDSDHLPRLNHLPTQKADVQLEMMIVLQNFSKISAVVKSQAMM